MRLAIAVIACAGCVTTHRLVVTGAEIHAVLPALRAHGTIEMDATDDATDQEDKESYIPQRVSLGFEQTVTLPHGTRTIAQLAYHCPDVPPANPDEAPDCELAQRQREPFELRSWQTTDFAPIWHGAVAVSVIGLLTAAAICTGKCADGWPKTTSEITLGTTGALLLGGIVWAIVRCSGHWGEPGCRD